MGINPLDPASAAGRPDRDVSRGHGTRALGPSDSSDTGSDLVGAPPLPQDEGVEEREASDIGADHIEKIPDDLEDDIEEQE